MEADALSAGSAFDWDTISEEELQAIEEACEIAEAASLKRKRTLPPSWGSSPCTLRPFKAVSPQVRYPVMNFGGCIVYSRTLAEVESATVQLLKIIEAKRQSTDCISMGFDIEWRPIFKRGEVPRKAAVMQICVDSAYCFVMHIFHSGIPPLLQSLLEDDTLVKVGVCIANDAKKILYDYNVHIRVLEDLSGLANRKLGEYAKKWSLSSLAEMLTSKQLEKPNNIRMGNWEADELSTTQVKYAATDAYASWYLYQVLQSFPDATETLHETKKSDS
ncbi:Werner Syndrome-like exonuclease isoform X1 [Amborella trichopoda]|nr:Werner Syndrome-like exonuclease isoform X1 [Amborella trichopoda]|eukprot:XP_006854444.2 Werner Syndrome-like exonuclease isoform X1 [Amborella trichopoda]